MSEFRYGDDDIVDDRNIVSRAIDLMESAGLRRFDTEDELVEYVDRLNESGVSPEIPLMDSAGICLFGTLQAPGGDGWGFAYYAVTNGDEGTIQGEENGWVRPARYLSEYRDDWDRQPGWKPAWPVFGIVADLT